MNSRPLLRRRWLIGALVVVAAVAAVIASRAVRRVNGAPEFEFAEITRGTLENIISGTGQLQAVGTVQVGTQVSGTLESVRVDFNDQVRKGQVLAVLDTLMLSAAVTDARAGVMRTQAELDRATREFERDEDLFAKRFVTEAQYQNSKTSMETATASLLSAHASYDRAEANLRHAVITSPIDGKVIQRAVEPGQTVAASFSTPTLFLIAEDLSRMEILGLVDESDIGTIKVGLPVRFTVEAYWDRTFEGTVRQIRLQPQVLQNVVTYTVVIDVNNTEGLLYPGMTATIDFIAERVEDALLVASKALQFTPSDDMLQGFRARMEKMREARGDTAGGARGFRHGGASPESDRTRLADVARMWYLDERGDLSVIMARKGATDGTQTVITPMGLPGLHPQGGEGRMRPEGRMTPPFMGAELKEGLKVITSVKTVEKEKKSSNRNPVMPPGGFRP
ncbi:MAG: efflux RND transporter periplasmic adaptor subunit [Candidatus Eisenbacteria bacterium]|jgi:HlyD family secretion protein|nr:efflux RND transporter periplasmic adaptor subunit [Candidatus Eisenbacteria bacterium]